MGSCTCLIPATWVTAATIMAGLSVLTLIILLLSVGGQRQLLGAEFGGMAVSPAMALICLWSPATHLTPAVTGWAAKQSFVCNPGPSLPVSLPTTGRLPIGFRWITAIRIWAASAPRWSMCLVLTLRNWCLRLAKMGMPTW